MVFGSDLTPEDLPSSSLRREMSQPPASPDPARGWDELVSILLPFPPSQHKLVCAGEKAAVLRHAAGANVFYQAGWSFLDAAAPAGEARPGQHPKAGGTNGRDGLSARWGCGR